MKGKEVLENIFKTGMLKDIINNIGGGENTENLQDLEMDIYLYFLENRGRLEILEKLHNVNQDKYYLTRIVLNQIRSKNSPYYYRYKKNALREEEITTNETEKGEELH